MNKLQHFSRKNRIILHYKLLTVTDRIIIHLENYIIIGGILFFILSIIGMYG